MNIFVGFRKFSNAKDIGINFFHQLDSDSPRPFDRLVKKVLKFKFLPVENSYQSILQALKTQNVVGRQISSNFEKFFYDPVVFISAFDAKFESIPKQKPHSRSFPLLRGWDNKNLLHMYQNILAAFLELETTVSFNFGIFFQNGHHVINDF